MSAERFLELAAERGLLDKKTVGDLRNQLRAKGPAQVSADQLAKLLIQRERLTKYQVATLMEALARPVRVADDVLELAPDDDDEDITELAPMDVIPAEPVSPRVSATRPLAKGLQSPTPLPDLGSGTGVDDDVSEAIVEADLATSAFPSGTTPSRPFEIANWLAPFRRRRHTGMAPVFRWDSKLMLFGGGTLFLILAFGSLLYYQLSRGSGDELFELADKDYTSQAYTQAIGKFEKYLSRYDGHAKNSLAKVRIGLAKIRQQVESENWPAALSIAEEVLPPLTSEKSMEDARPELAGVLPQIYAGFAKRAEEARNVDEKESLLKSAEAAAKLVNAPEYLPASQRKGLADQLEQIESTIASVHRDIDRERQLAATITKIEDATSQGDTRQAYLLHSQLVTAFPGLRGNPRLTATLDKVAEGEKRVVRSLPPQPPPTKEDPPPFPGRRVVLLNRQVTASPPTQGVCYAKHQGALVALSLADGAFLWRRWLGNAGNLAPCPLGMASWSDVVAHDPAREDLFRLDSRTGTLVWRTHSSAPITDLTFVEGEVFCTNTQHQLLVINPENGESRGVEFPQEVTVAPGVIADPRVIVQPADQSTIYLLDGKSLACVATRRLGHGAGTLDIPPVVQGRFVFILENAGSDFCWLHTLVLAGNPSDGLTILGEPIRLPGNVHVPPAAFGNRLLVSTDRDALAIFEIDPAAPTNPPKQIATLVGSGNSAIDAFPLFQEDQILVGGRGTAQYRLQAANGRLVRVAIDGQNDIHVSSPLWIAADTLIRFVRGESSDGLQVQAVRVAQGANPSPSNSVLWSTGLGSRLASEPLVDATHKGLICVDQEGTSWEITSEDLGKGLVDKVAQLPVGGMGVGGRIRLDANRSLFAFRDRHPEVLVLDPAKSRAELRRVKLLVPHKRLACDPLPWEGGIVVCTEEGGVFWINPDSGELLAIPFQPALAPGQTIAWITPAPLPEPSKGFIVADAKGHLQRLELQSEGAKPTLRLMADVQLGPTLVADLVAIGEVVVAIQRTDEADQALIVGMGGLDQRAAIKFDGRVAWGPRRVGDAVLLSTSQDELLALGGDGTVIWRSKLKGGPLAGAPMLRGDSLIGVSVSGNVWRVDAKTGTDQAWEIAGETKPVLETGEGIGAGGALFGDRLMLTGRDAVLNLIALPE